MSKIGELTKKYETAIIEIDTNIQSVEKEIKSLLKI